MQNTWNKTDVRAYPSMQSNTHTHTHTHNHPWQTNNKQRKTSKTHFLSDRGSLLIGPLSLPIPNMLGSKTERIVTAELTQTHQHRHLSTDTSSSRTHRQHRHISTDTSAQTHRRYTDTHQHRHRERIVTEQERDTIGL